MDEVTVIIPTKNRDNLLRRAVNSVLKQTFSILECLVVDDGRPGKTKEVLASFRDSRIHYLRNERGQGASGARNTGLGRAQGSLIAFLDDDDEWLPTKLEKQVKLLQNLPPNYGMVYCWLEFIDQGGPIRARKPQLSGDIFRHVLENQPIGNASTLLVKEPAIREIGLFDEALPRGNDGDFIRRLSLRYAVDYVPEILVKVHIGHGHGRITRDDRSGVINAIRGERAKLEKFSEILVEYPRQAAVIHAKIGAHYARLGSWGDALSSYVKAIRSYPFSADVHRRFIAGVKAGLVERD